MTNLVSGAVVAELDKNTRAQVLSAFAAALVTAGLVFVFALRGLGIVVGWVFVSLGVLLFGRLLIDKRTRHVLRHPMSSRKRKQEPPERSPFIRDPSKSYRAVAGFVMEGDGLRRQMRATLREIGRGWDGGVRLELSSPLGEIHRHEWDGVNEEIRTKLEKEGDTIGALWEGPYICTWWGTGSSEMQDELIESLQFHAPKVGLPGWQANHRGGIETPLILRCTPPNEAGARQRVSVFVEGPVGSHHMEPWNQVRLTGVLPPGMAGVNGIFNDYHYVVYPDGFDELKGKRLEDGWYGVEWRVEQGVGTAVADVDTFRIANGMRTD
jgi:hypothetical protein